VGFYRGGPGLGMEEIARRSREERDEKWSMMRSADGRGSDVVLMGFTDGGHRN